MDILHARCAGLDVHKDFVTACVLLPGEGSEPSKHLEQFGTTTQELRRLSQWLEQEQVTQAALIPVAHTIGTEFRPGPRSPQAEHVHWDSYTS